MTPEELIGQVFSSEFVDEFLCVEFLGGDKFDVEAAARFLDLPILSRPEISVFFDRQYYLQRYADVREAGVDPLVHFVTLGCSEGRSPHPLVDPGHIRTIDSHLLPEAYTTEHLYDVLVFDLCDTSPYFILSYYKSQIEEDKVSGKDGLLSHFLRFGLARGLKPNPLFDPIWYAEQRGEGGDPLAAIRHFVLSGDIEGEAPSPLFSGWRYLQKYRDVAEAQIPALAHYLTRGQMEGRVFLPERHEPDQVTALVMARQDMKVAEVDPVHSRMLYSFVMDAVREDRQRQKEAVDVVVPDFFHFEDPSSHLSDLKIRRVRSPKVSILVPIFNEFRYTTECIASIVRSRPEISYEVVVADDASPDPDVRLLYQVKNIKIVRQPSNVGFLENCNRAFLECRGSYLLLLNNDAQLLPGALDRMAEVLDSDPLVAAVGPKILYPNGRLQEAGCSLDRDGISAMVGLFADPDKPEFNRPRDVDYCSGAALLLRRSCLGKTLFDERFKPAYCEDADLCLELLNKGFKIRYCPSAKVVHHLSVSTNKQSVERRLQTVTKNQQKLAEKWAPLLEKMNAARVIAFYLPQYHPTPENDFYWGMGFTEWTNVAKALPGYVGHYQPHLPADLGFYDLRVRQTIERQAALAQRYGIDGFCVYYYNFGSRRALDIAFEAIVADTRIPFPYCICWANENWTRHWDGGSREIIFEQQYDQRTLDSIIQDAVRYAKDPRYLRVDGKPLFLVYRPLMIPEPKAFADRCRAAFRNAAFPDAHLVYVESMETSTQGIDPEDLGFDACVEFPPQGRAKEAKDIPTIIRNDFAGTLYDYEATVIAEICRSGVGYKRYPSVFPSWDNTSRQPQRGNSFIGISPEAFQAYVEEKLEHLRQFYTGEERLLFVNAWNEWAEGTHLEPDQRFGHRWLEAIRNAKMAKSLA